MILKLQRTILILNLRLLLILIVPVKREFKMCLIATLGLRRLDLLEMNPILTGIPLPSPLVDNAIIPPLINLLDLRREPSPDAYLLNIQPLPVNFLLIIDEIT